MWRTSIGTRTLAAPRRNWSGNCWVTSTFGISPPTQPNNNWPCCARNWSTRPYGKVSCGGEDARSRPGRIPRSQAPPGNALSCRLCRPDARRSLTASGYGQSPVTRPPAGTCDRKDVHSRGIQSMRYAFQGILSSGTSASISPGSGRHNRSAILRRPGPSAPRARLQVLGSASRSPCRLRQNYGPDPG